MRFSDTVIVYRRTTDQTVEWTYHFVPVLAFDNLVLILDSFVISVLNETGNYQVVSHYKRKKPGSLQAYEVSLPNDVRAEAVRQFANRIQAIKDTEI